jgi:hypothetical protein
MLAGTDAVALRRRLVDAIRDGIPPPTSENQN